MLHNLIKRI